MIRFVDGEWAALFEASIGKFGIFGTKIYSQYQTYGTLDGVLDLWLLLEGDRAVGAASRLDGIHFCYQRAHTTFTTTGNNTFEQDISYCIFLCLLYSICTIFPSAPGAKCFRPIQFYSQTFTLKGMIGRNTFFAAASGKDK